MLTTENVVFHLTVVKRDAPYYADLNGVKIRFIKNSHVWFCRLNGDVMTFYQLAGHYEIQISKVICVAVGVVTTECINLLTNRSASVSTK